MSVFYTPFPRIVVLNEQERQQIQPMIRKARKREFGILANMNANEEERLSRLIAFRLDWSEIDTKRKADIAQPYGYLFDQIVFAAEPETFLNLGHLEGLYRSAERTSAVWHGDTELNEKVADAIFAYAKAYFGVLFDYTCALYTNETKLLFNLAETIAYYRWSFARHPRSAFKMALVPLQRSISDSKRPERFQVDQDFLTQMTQVHEANMGSLLQAFRPRLAEEGDPSKHLEDMGKQVIASMFPGLDVDGMFAKIKDALTEKPANK
jgi:hypothetical protein